MKNPKIVRKAAAEIVLPADATFQHRNHAGGERGCAKATPLRKIRIDASRPFHSVRIGSIQLKWLAALAFECCVPQKRGHAK
ncbi:hypothetical protein GR183_06920 [Stappia sp. GBMRC 2046]|uniref:Uncharacterized protein n=1 Tax=Stappia sediminis TaxID=2692190 RepID=A0A7X3LT67_9HYPH|nr:hypothetical protein [Stappia sediminis]MXN64631.1 hypothetical protein [Stappia sediminis]